MYNSKYHCLITLHMHIFKVYCYQTWEMDWLWQWLQDAVSTIHGICLVGLFEIVYILSILLYWLVERYSSMNQSFQVHSNLSEIHGHIFVLFLPLKTLFFLEHFWVHSKIERKVEIPMEPPTHAWSSPITSISTRWCIC